MTVIVDGYAVNYEVKGAGPVVLLLHGWGDSLTTFNVLSDALSDDYTVVRLDLLGFGGSDAPKKPFDLEKYAEFVSLFLQKTGMKPYAIIGHSNGGAVAIKGCSEGRLKANKLILLASSGVRSTYKGRKKLLRLAAKAAKLPTNLLPKTTQQKMKKKAYSLVGSDLFVAEHLQETFKQVVNEDLVESAGTIAQPTLLVYGSEDTATPPDYGARFRSRIKNSRLIIVEGAGHFLHHTHSEKVNQLVKEFLTK